MVIKDCPKCRWSDGCLERLSSKTAQSFCWSDGWFSRLSSILLKLCMCLCVFLCVFMCVGVSVSVCVSQQKSLLWSFLVVSYWKCHHSLWCCDFLTFCFWNETSLCSHSCFWTTGARSMYPWFHHQLLTVNILRLRIVLTGSIFVSPVVFLDDRCQVDVSLISSSTIDSEHLEFAHSSDRKHIAICVFGRQVPGRCILDFIINYWQWTSWACT